MQSYLKTKPVWVQLLLFIGMALGIFVVLSIAGVWILSKITHINLLDVSDPDKWDSSNPNMITFVRGMLIVQFLGLFLVPSLLFAYFSDPKALEYVGFRRPVRHIYWFIAVVTLMVAIPLVEYTGVLNRHLLFPEGLQKWMQSMEDEAAKQIQFMLSRHSVTELILNITLIAGLAAVGEELFFRGVLQRLFIRAFKNPWAGIIVAAFLFSGFHLQFFGFIPRLLLGILLGAIYWYSGSLWTAIVAHFVYDGFFIVLAYFQPKLVQDTEATVFNESSLALLALMSTVLLVVLILMMRKHSTVTYDSVYTDDKLQQEQDPSF
ncbi:MAG: CPBP family intramembrane metalloprotease [Chitinophagaceae bacterium]|nr:CPBP family intramembrane metalloprotease [Chitinophagaceae bacterium]